ncbi:MAG: RDD family protein [Vicinamibacterales bacterium]
MKCPKCQYLGFETGDRCKNCGYDFSLVEFRSTLERQIEFARPSDPAHETSQDSWDRFDSAPGAPLEIDVPLYADTAPSGVVDAVTEPPLPLFALTAEDQPLVRLPAAPRRPLAVRRTPEHPRLRPPVKPLAEPVPLEPTHVEPELDFPEESVLTRTPPQLLLRTEEATPVQRTPAFTPAVPLHASAPRRRFIAACIDYTLLCGIDVAIVYFTVRMAGLDMSDWRLLPIMPLGLFLVVIALSYVGVFTAIGGQTIGKMAARIRVVSDDPVPVGAAHAVRRTAAVMVSWLTGGLGFLPALVGEHRALHDRLSRTRVVDLA